MEGKIQELNLSERLLQNLAHFNSLVKGTFSTDLNADVQPDDSTALHSGILGDIASQLTRLPQDLQLGLQILDNQRNHGLTDDKKYMVENIIKFAASLPEDSLALKALSSKFIDALWTNLPHPPLTYIGDEYRYRTANGSNNNRLCPHLGQAGSPYARTVPPRKQLPPTLPDPGVLFDELMARKEHREHPNKISSVLFYVATIIIHDIFRTDTDDWNKVGNSSYLDLSPLYGNSKSEQKRVRTGKDGKLKPDAFAEERLLGFPPGVCALLVLFNRFHNYIAGELATINEGGRFTAMDEATWKKFDHSDIYETPEDKRDNDLFQTARLVTCGLYINIILVDYVRTILNLNQSDSEWSLDPRENSVAKAYGPSNVPEGIGNQVSVEFNLVYRWHSTISSKDEQWTIDFFKTQFQKMSNGNKDFDINNIELKDLVLGLGDFVKTQKEIDPGERTFGGLKRQKDGAFRDEDIMTLMRDSTEDVAGAFGARNVPVVMRAVEVLGISQARRWNVATLNEFRQYFGMIPHKTFGDITSDPQVAKSLEALYGDPSNVELYPGIVVEDAKEPQFPGSGLCPGFTISKAILADAVALVRGDRFYTVDYNATTLTNWGFNQVASDKTVCGGGVFYKLIMRGLPGYYRTGSVYAMFPLTVPQKTHEILTSLGKQKDFDFSRPAFKPPPVEVESWKTCAQVLNDSKNFKVPWGPHIKYMSHGRESPLTGDSPTNLQEHASVYQIMYSPTHGMDQIREMYEKITLKLLYEKSHKLRYGFQVDAVADIANLSHAMAIGELFHLSVKTPEEPIGVLTPQQVYTILTIMFAWVFLDVDEVASFKLRQGAGQTSEALGKIVKTTVELVQNEWFQGLKHLLGRDISTDDLAKGYGTALIRRFSKGGKSADDVTWAMIPTMVAGVATQAQAFSQMLDTILSEPYFKDHWKHIQELAQSNDPKSFELLERYALELCRLNPQAGGLYRNVEAESITLKDKDRDGNKKTINLKKGDVVFTNFINASMDPEVFDEPEKIKLDRDLSKYIYWGIGPHACVGQRLNLTALTTQLKIFGRLRNLRRAPGPQGNMKYKTVNKAFKVYMKPDWSDYWPFPSTMKVMYDAID